MQWENPAAYHRTKAFPLGGRWHGEAVTDEGRSVNTTTSAKKPTFQPRISQKSKIFASFSPGRSLSGTSNAVPHLPYHAKKLPQLGEAFGFTYTSEITGRIMGLRLVVLYR